MADACRTHQPAKSVPYVTATSCALWLCHKTWPVSTRHHLVLSSIQNFILKFLRIAMPEMHKIITFSVSYYQDLFLIKNNYESKLIEKLVNSYNSQYSSSLAADLDLDKLSVSSVHMTSGQALVSINHDLWSQHHKCWLTI